VRGYKQSSLLTEHKKPKEKILVKRKKTKKENTGKGKEIM
jgi:hypothetical protein